MATKLIIRLAAVLAVTSIAAPLLRALPDAEATAGRLILRRYADAVVTIKGTVTLRVTVDDRPMPPQDNKIDVSGTVIAPRGIVVTSFSLIDPKAIFDNLRSKFTNPGLSVKLAASEVKELRIVLGDGTEIPVHLLVKDADRDIALLEPDSGAGNANRTLTFVDLGAGTDSAQILGDYFDVSRMNEDLQHAPIVRPTTVIGIVERPHRVILVTASSYGCPVFDAQGRVLGICLRLVSNGVPGGPVVVSASDIIDVASRVMPL